MTAVEHFKMQTNHFMELNFVCERFKIQSNVSTVVAIHIKVPYLKSNLISIV